MIVRGHRLTELPELRLEPIASPQTSHEWVESADPRWIDVEGASHEKLLILLDSLKLHPLILEALEQPGQGPRYLLFDGAIYVSAPARNQVDEDRASYLAILVLSNLVITIHQNPVLCLQTLSNESTHNILPIGRDVGAIAYLILDALIDRAAELAIGVRDQVEDLYRLYDESSESVQIKSVHNLKQKSSYLLINYEDMQHALASLQTTESPFFQASRYREYYRDLVEHLGYSISTMQRIENRLHDIQQRHYVHLQERANARLRILTIVSTIFMPLTFICSIYGMNFENMPEIKWQYGYFFVLAILATIGASLAWFFRSRGWLDDL